MHWVVLVCHALLASEAHSVYTKHIAAPLRPYLIDWQAPSWRLKSHLATSKCYDAILLSTRTLCQQGPGSGRGGRNHGKFSDAFWAKAMSRTYC